MVFGQLKRRSGRMCAWGRLGSTNRATDGVCNHPTGLTPSSVETGEDLAPMMPDCRNATERAMFIPCVGGA